MVTTPVSWPVGSWFRLRRTQPLPLPMTCPLPEFVSFQVPFQVPVADRAVAVVVVVEAGAVVVGVVVVAGLVAVVGVAVVVVVVVLGAVAGAVVVAGAAVVVVG